MTTWRWFLVAMGVFLLIQGVITVVALLRMRQRRLRDERHRRLERRTERQWRAAMEQRSKDHLAGGG